MSRPHSSSAPGLLRVVPHHRLMVGLAALALLVAWLSMARLAESDPWYDHVEQNVHGMTDALALNSDAAPGRVDQPGLPARYLLALDYRVRHYLGQLPVWNFKKFGDRPDPLAEIPALLRLGRVHGQILVLLFILTGAGLVYSVTRSGGAALFATVLLSCSAGLLFHGLQNRPDLLCAWFGTVLMPFCLWRSGTAASRSAGHAWLFLAGLGAGLAVLTKLPGLYYFVAGYAWCWLIAAMGGGPAAGKTRFISFFLPVASSAALFWLLIRLIEVPEALSPAALMRLRVAAAVVGALPLVALSPGRGRLGTFLRERGLELALLGGGALASVALSYAALRAVMTAPTATEYLARVLQFTAHPDPQMKYLLAATPHVGREFFAFVREAPFLFTSALAMAVAVGLARPVPARLKVFVFLLLGHAVAMMWLLGHRAFLGQFSVFAQVPLLLLWAVGLSALGVWPKKSPDAAGAHWAVPAIATSCAVLIATLYLRLEPKQRLARTETAPPLSNLTRAYLYNHDAHPLRYRQIMQQHYPVWDDFTRAIDQYLADPAPPLNSPAHPPSR